MCGYPQNQQLSNYFFQIQQNQSKDFQNNSMKMIINKIKNENFWLTQIQIFPISSTFFFLKNIKLINLINFFYQQLQYNQKIKLLMQSGQLQKYQQISKLYKEIIDAITTLQISQFKLYLVNLEKRINNKQSFIFQDFHSLNNLLDNTKQAKGKVPLHFAVARGNLEIIKHLIESIHVDHSIKDKEGNTPFFTAIEHGHVEVVKYFIEDLKYSPNQTKEGEISTLHIAANHNHADLLHFLIEKGSNIQKVSIYGKPINWAVGNRHFEATKILLDHGADPNGDSTGTSLAPLILAVDYKDTQIYKLLLSKAANPNIKDPNGYSVLHVAAEKGDLQIVKDLIERGAEVNLQVQGKSPLYLAFQHSKWNVVNFLKEKSQNYEKTKRKIEQQHSKKQNSQANKERAQQIKIAGNKLYTEKRYSEALSEYLKALQFDQENEIIHRNIAACYLALKQFQQALFHCYQAKKKDSKNVKTIYREAQANIGLGNLIEATSNMWQCSMLQPSNQVFRTQFQRLFEQAKKKHQNNQASK